jgi:hypothetical protein
MEANTMTNQEQANIETLCGETATRRGYELFNVNGDYLSTLTERELDFVQSHQCISDCRRVGCETVGVKAL